MNKAKHYGPEEIVGTGELVVYLSDYAALEAERERLEYELDRQSVITGDYIARCQRLADERDALAAENARLRADLEQSRDLIVEMSKHCNATALVADWLERNT